ncbi:predicted protein [Chaetoceros tenuissimus]|uniref:Uncharacterized protein n=1 Tax=Chaetoceros tenuissimus TaxID=426638 RepID=A0AAD3CUR8_9STRA|nr:predicted protein [Chaetoceros tenuissimus]
MKTYDYGDYNESNDEEVKAWIKNQHDNFPLHRLCCSEDPIFNQTTFIPTKEECFRKDDCGNIPLIYLIYNNTAEYDIMEEIVKIGGKDSLLIEDRTGLNALHRAWEVGDRAVIRLLVLISENETCRRCREASRVQII